MRPCESCGRATWACASACARRSRRSCGPPSAQPLTVLGDLVHNETVLERLRRPRRPRSPGTRRGGHAVRGDHGPRRVRTAPGSRARPRLHRARRNLPDREGRSSSRGDVGAGRIPPGHRRHSAPRRGPRADRGPGRVRRRVERSGRGGAPAAAAVRGRRADDTADRAGAAPRVAVAPPAPAFRGPGGGDRVHADEVAAGSGGDACRGMRRHGRGRRRREQQHARTGRHVQTLLPACLSSFRTPGTCGPGGSRGRGWLASPLARPRPRT